MDRVAFLDANPEVTDHCTAAIGIPAGKSSALSLFKARDAVQLGEKLRTLLTTDASSPFQEFLTGLWNKEAPLTRETVIETLEGDRRFVALTFAVIPGHGAALSRLGEAYSV